MTKIKDSIVATSNSSVNDSSINKSKDINIVKRKTFIKGFLSGVIASVIANYIFYYFTS